MNPLLIEVLQWMQNNNYRRASFDRLCGIIPSASTYDQLYQLVSNNPAIFRTATLKGGLPGLALLDDVYIPNVLQLAETPAPTLEIAPTLPNFGTPDAPFADQARYGYGYTPPPPTPIIVADEPAATESPTVTPDAVANEIATEHYRNLGGALKTVNAPANNVTLCVLTLKNGFVIIGKSACVYSERFNEELGRKLAREDAVKQVWPYLGFRLADQRIS